MEDQEQAALDELGERFLAALRRKEAGALDQAEDEFRAILRLEPRLAEPRLELARLLLDTDRVAEAEDQARESLELLQAGHVWIDDPPEHVVRALAHATLAEALRRKADEDDVIFGDPAAFRAILREAQENFAQAATLDPREEYASYHAFFLGIEGAQVEPILPPDDPEAPDEPVGEA